MIQRLGITALLLSWGAVDALPVLDAPSDVGPLHLGSIPSSSMADCS